MAPHSSVSAPFIVLEKQVTRFMISTLRMDVEILPHTRQVHLTATLDFTTDAGRKESRVLQRAEYPFPQIGQDLSIEIGLYDESVLREEQGLRHAFLIPRSLTSDQPEIAQAVAAVSPKQAQLNVSFRQAGKPQLNLQNLGTALLDTLHGTFVAGDRVNSAPFSSPLELTAQPFLLPASGSLYREWESPPTLEEWEAYQKMRLADVNPNGKIPYGVDQAWEFPVATGMQQEARFESYHSWPLACLHARAILLEKIQNRFFRRAFSAHTLSRLLKEYWLFILNWDSGGNRVVDPWSNVSASQPLLKLQLGDEDVLVQVGSTSVGAIPILPFLVANPALQQALAGDPSLSAPARKLLVLAA